MRGIAAAACCICALCAGSLSAQLAGENYEESTGTKKVEDEPPLPQFPKPQSLVEFHVSAVASNRFFIDADSLSVSGGTVRYVLVVKAAGGATNISFEGIRCSTNEYKLYATGPTEGTWSKARLGIWRRIEDQPVNRQHAVLSREYFCPGRIIIASAEEGRDAIRRGKHPRTSQY